MKKILVTGGAGYIGSHAVRALVDLGHKVTVIDNLSKGHAAAVHPGAFFSELDLGDRIGLDRIFAEGQFDAVLHFAGSIEVGLSMKDPQQFFLNNCQNGVNLLEAMRAHAVDTIIFSSTAAVYGNPETVPIREDSALVPMNFYGLSKLLFEQILKKYEEFYGFKYAALRYFNAAGAHPTGEIGQDYEPATHLISRVLQTALGKISGFKIFGHDYLTPDGTCVRDYIHVCDLVDAHVLALDYLSKNKKSITLNLGNGKGFSVKQVIEAAEKVVGRKIQASNAQRREGDPAFLVADSTEAKRVLGWKPRYYNLEDIVGTAWKWHSGHPQGYRDRKVT